MLLSSNWVHGPDWLINQNYPDQISNNVVIIEIVAEMNVIAAVESVVDLSRFSKLSRVLWVMTIVLKFLRTNNNSFEALVKQKQQSHTNSRYKYLKINGHL